MDKSRMSMTFVREKQAKLEAEIPIMQQRLQDQKALFRDLEITDALCEELSRRPEEALSLREFVCVQMHKAKQIYHKQAESARQATQVQSLTSSQCLCIRTIKDRNRNFSQSSLCIV